jgi:hypothetical protein
VRVARRAARGRGAGTADCVKTGFTFARAPACVCFGRYGLLTEKFGGEHMRAAATGVKNAVLGGVVGGAQGTFARYGLSEEFTAVYRLHSLLPDTVVVLPMTPPSDAASSGAKSASVNAVAPEPPAPVSIPLARTRHTAVSQLLREHGLETLAASFGVQQPGLLGGCSVGRLIERGYCRPQQQAHSTSTVSSFCSPTPRAVDWYSHTPHPLRPRACSQQ